MTLDPRRIYTHTVLGALPVRNSVAPTTNRVWRFRRPGRIDPAPLHCSTASSSKKLESSTYTK